MVRVLLVRHGLACYETDLVTDDGGWLSEEGRAQARALGRAVLGTGVTSVWSSPLSRAVQTAELVASVLGIDTVTVREGLREYGVGEVAGCGADEESARIGPVFRAWVDGDDGAEIPGGQPISQLVERVTRVLEEVAERQHDGAALVVSHGGAIMATVPVLVGLPRSAAFDLQLAGGGHVVLEHGVGRWRLISGQADLSDVRLPYVGKGKVRKLPKTECCVSKERCGRCPLRMLREGTLPVGYTVKRRQLVRLDGKKVTKKKLAKAA